MEVRPPRLNPLHCGAVVASTVLLAAIAAYAIPSQSPSLRGSGRFIISNAVGRRVTYQSQSPSLRGSGRFRQPAQDLAQPGEGLNPLHCGEWSLLAGESTWGSGWKQVSIPFIAGQWSLPSRAASTLISCSTSQSPSLRGSGRFTESNWPLPGGPGCLNPLHCGAVVASGKACRRRPAAAQRLNPLHCGAVVASRSLRTG